MSIIPTYQVEGGTFDPEDIVDLVPEQAASNNAIQASEDRRLRQLLQNEEDKYRRDQRTLEGLGNLSQTMLGIAQERKEKHRADREAVIAYEMATVGVAPELEEVFRGDRELLFEDSLQAEEFANKLDEAGDSITANKFREMPQWEKYIVAEEWTRREAKDYHQYRLEALETTTVKVEREGQEVTIGGQSENQPENEAEEEALEEKIKFNFTRRFGGLNEVLVATVVKPELDAYDALRRKEQIIKREEARQQYLEERDKDSIKNGFITANQSDGYNNAHRFAEQYATRNKTSLGAGRTAFKDTLISLVKAGDIDPVDVGPMLLYEEESRGGKRSMTSWKEWEDLPDLLAEASVAYKQAEIEDRDNQIALDEQKIRSRDDWTNDEKAILRQLYKQKEEYDGRVPSELESALAGHEEDYLAEERLETALRRQGNILYDYQLANVSNDVYRKYSNQVRGTSALTPGTADAQDATAYIKAATDKTANLQVGDTVPATAPWLNANTKLTTEFNKKYREILYDTDGNQIATREQAFQAAKSHIDQLASNEDTRDWLMSGDYDPTSDNERWQNIVSGVKVGAGGNWKFTVLPATIEDQRLLKIWAKDPEPKTGNLPEYYLEVAKQLQVLNPYDLAQTQVALISDGELKVKDRKIHEIENKPNRVRLIYGYPTRSRQTRAVIDYGLEVSGQEQNAKTSIYNKQAITTPGV